jgi:hypothetical protein
LHFRKDRFAALTEFLTSALDLSGELIVQLGLVTDDLNRRW